MPEARFLHTFTLRGPQSAGPAELPQSGNPESSLTRDLPFVRLNAEFQLKSHYAGPCDRKSPFTLETGLEPRTQRRSGVC